MPASNMASKIVSSALTSSSFLDIFKNTFIGLAFFATDTLKYSKFSGPSPRVFWRSLRGNLLCL